MSRYDNDPRVAPPTVDDAPYVLPDTHGPILIERRHSHWVVTLPDGYLTDPGDRSGERPWMFDSSDEAIQAVIGDPR